MKNCIARRAGFFLLGVTGLLLLQSCSGATAKEEPQLDLAAEALPYQPPQIEALTSLPGAPPLPEPTQAVLELRRAFFARDFAQLDATLNAQHRDYVEGRIDVAAADRFVDSLKDTQLAGIDACAEWLRAMPASYAAHWACGAMWQKGAWIARGTKYASEVSYAQFAIMDERLRRSNELLAKALTLDDKPIEALVWLATNHHMEGNDAAAEQYLLQAEQLKPQYPDAHDTRLNFSLPEWGGSAEQVKAAFERAKTAGVDQISMLNFEDSYIARPRKMTNPGAARAYWEKAISERPTRKRLSSLLQEFIWLENWKEALPVADRLIAEYPDETAAYYQRARAYERLGRMPETWNDYLMAAAMGHELALQELISAHIRGGLGITEKSTDAVVEFCRYGATLGNGVGANCIGSLFFEGESAGINFRSDPAQALAWHLVGARGGHFNSQYDLGWLLFTGRGGSVEPEAAKRLGIFWMRRATEQGHHYAKRKLEENKIELSEEPAAENGWGLNVGTVLSALYALIQIWI